MVEAQNTKIVQDVYAAFGRFTLRNGKVSQFQEFCDSAALDRAFEGVAARVG